MGPSKKTINHQPNGFSRDRPWSLYAYLNGSALYVNQGLCHF